MNDSKLIGIRYLSVGDRKVPVVLMRNETGSVAGQCLLGNDERPIIDGPTVAEVLAMIASCIDGLLFAREARHA
jgi:hypothetical protein